MPTKNTTTSTNQYDPSSMNVYKPFQGQIGTSLMQMVQNPLGSSYFKNQLAQQQGVSNQIAARSNTNVLRNARTGGGILSNSGGYMAGMLNRNQLTNSVMQGNAFNSSLNNALNSRNVGLSGMQAYQPLQTGQTSVQQQSGVGTWLPQVAGAALNMLAPGIGSMLGGQGFSAGYQNGGGGSAAPASGQMRPFGGVQTPNFYMQQNYPQAQLPQFQQ